MSTLFAVIAMIAITNTTLVAVVTQPRILYGMANEDVVPGVFAKIHADPAQPVGRPALQRRRRRRPARGRHRASPRPARARPGRAGWPLVTVLFLLFIYALVIVSCAQAARAGRGRADLPRQHAAAVRRPGRQPRHPRLVDLRRPDVAALVRRPGRRGRGAVPGRVLLRHADRPDRASSAATPRPPTEGSLTCTSSSPRTAAQQVRWPRKQPEVVRRPRRDHRHLGGPRRWSRPLRDGRLRRRACRRRTAHGRRPRGRTTSPQGTPRSPVESIAAGLVDLVLVMANVRKLSDPVRARRLRDQRAATRRAPCFVVAGPATGGSATRAGGGARLAGPGGSAPARSLTEPTVAPAPRRTATISARIDTAISPGSSAPMSRPIGARTVASACLGRRRSRAATRGAGPGYVASPSRRRTPCPCGQRGLDRRAVEPVVVAEHDHARRRRRGRPRPGRSRLATAAACQPATAGVIVGEGCRDRTLAHDEHLRGRLAMPVMHAAEAAGVVGRST